MESTITGTVADVTGRTVNTSRGQASIFDVLIGTQKASTFKSEIAEQANALKGSTVRAFVDVSERNGYTNYTLKGVELLDAAPSSAPTTSTISVAPTSGGMSPEREARIVRQSSMATAFNYAAAAGLSEDEAFALAGRIYARAMGETQPEPVAAGATETSDGIPW